MQPPLTFVGSFTFAAFVVTCQLALTQNIDIRPLQTLQANRDTAVLTRGNKVDVWQASGDAVLRTVSTAPDSRTLALAKASLGSLLGAIDADVEAHSLAVLPDGATLLYVGGWANKRSMASLRVVSNPGRTSRVLVDAASLASASGMGDSLDLARGQLATSGSNVWLWLRHVDRSVFFRFDARQLAAGEGRLVRPFLELTRDGRPWLPGPQTTLTGRADGSFWLLDQGGDSTAGESRAATLWQVNDQGQVTPADWPIDGPPPSVPPLPLGDGENAPQLYFYPRPRNLDPLLALASGDRERYPVLEIRRPGKPSVKFDRDAMTVRPTFPTHAVRITAWARDPATGDVFAYDRMSGEVLRITLPLAK